MKYNELFLKEIIKNGKTIKYNYEIGENWKNKLLENEKMYVTYDENIEAVPNSIAIIPFLSNILPISWIFDLTINIPEIDRVFYNSIENIKNGYKKMYPKLNFKGNVIVEK